MFAKLIFATEEFIFSKRKLLIILFLILTALMAVSASRLQIKAGFEKLLPLEHEYMQVFVKHKEEFGGGNRVMIALMSKDKTAGSMFTAEYMSMMEALTEVVYGIPAIEKSTVESIFTPNVRFSEITQEGITAENVIPADYDSLNPAKSLNRIRHGILKANIVGMLVANDLTGAAVAADVLDINPETQQSFNQVTVAKYLEEDYLLEQIQHSLRAKGIAVDGKNYTIHVIGFTKFVGDITQGASKVLLFFLIAFAITALLVFLYSRSLLLTVILLACSMAAVTWQLGFLPLIGFGLDPMSILVPFLIFAIAVSHGLQMLSAYKSNLKEGKQGQQAARASFRRLAVPGTIALLSDTMGFICILLIDIGVIQEMAITASLGVAVILITNLMLLPLILSYVNIKIKTLPQQTNKAPVAPFWLALASVSNKLPAALILTVALGLGTLGYIYAKQVKVGDLARGVPELRENSKYNLDTLLFADKFNVGVDILSVIVEANSEACSEYAKLRQINDFAWTMSHTAGVHSVLSLPQVTQHFFAAWNEGYLKWRELPRNQYMINQSVGRIEPSTGLLNSDCSAMPVYMFMKDHKAETINHVVQKVKQYNAQHGSSDLQFKLASGNVGVIAATNEEVDAAQFMMLVYVFGAIIIMCLITFRSVLGTLCIILPLALVSLLAYALMSFLEIGLKVNTLPVVALGVGIGVDYGIYIFSRLQFELKDSAQTLKQAYARTLSVTGFSVIITGITLAVGVATWVFSPLKFQADMGLLLTFMFLVNMLGAIFVLPALARLFFARAKK